MKPDNGNQNAADRLAQLELRLAQLENLPAIESALASQRAAEARDAHHQHLAVVRARADHREIEACSPSDRAAILNGMSGVIAWCLASPEGIDPMTWAPSLPSSARDELECRASVLPRRVRVGTLPRTVTFFPRAHPIVNNQQYAALVACGLSASITRIDNTWAYSSVGFDQPRIYPIETYLAIAGCDADLARFVADGSITVEELSDEQNVQTQIDQWRTVAAHDRPSFPRRKREPNTQTTPEAT